MECGRTFTWKVPKNKRYKEHHWFKLWITEGYSVRQLSQLSGHSQRKIHRIKRYWLSQEPPALSQRHFVHTKHFVFDGTYFHKDGCLAVFLNALSGKPVHAAYIVRENYENLLPLVAYLRAHGVVPASFTTDGHPRVIRALKEQWPNVIIQRCLFHIQNQGLMWLRTYPKTEAGKELRALFGTIAAIRTAPDRDAFMHRYRTWHGRYRSAIDSLPRDIVAYKDLKRARALIDNALPDMFHFISNPKIVSTTNHLESFFSQLKHHYRSHRGLSEKHKISFLKWYCYFKSVKK